MSRVFYQKFAELVFGALQIAGLMLLDTILLIFYVINSSIAYYIGFLGLVVFILFLGAKYYLDYQNFKESLSQGLLFPANVEGVANSFDLEPLDIPEDKALAVCTHYHNGSTYTEIQQNMGFKHTEQVKRYLLKGLDILLKEHNQKLKE